MISGASIAELEGIHLHIFLGRSSLVSGTSEKAMLPAEPTSMGAKQAARIMRSMHVCDVDVG